MNTKLILMVDIKHNGFPWVVVEKGKPVKKGFALSLGELVRVSNDEKVAGVWIDEGYGRMDIISEVRKLGWLIFKGRRNCYGPADIIEEMLANC